MTVMYNNIPGIYFFSHSLDKKHIFVLFLALTADIKTVI